MSDAFEMRRLNLNSFPGRRTFAEASKTMTAEEDCPSANTTGGKQDRNKTNKTTMAHKEHAMHRKRYSPALFDAMETGRADFITNSNPV